MKTALYIAVAALALGLAQPEAALANKAKQIDFVAKSKLKKACQDAGGDFGDHGEIYECHSDNAIVSCYGPNKQCFGETKTKQTTRSTGGKTQGGLAKPKAVLQLLR